MNKTKPILLSLSFALLLCVVCSYSVLPAQAYTVWTGAVTRDSKNGLGMTLTHYTLYMQVTTDGTYIVYHNSPYGEQAAYFGWVCNSHTEQVTGGGDGQTSISAHGNAHFSCWPMNLDVDCYMILYGNGNADYWSTASG